jgi:hypothetical protein
VAVAVELHATSVEESATAEGQHHENDYEQGSRVHLSLLCVSQTLLHLTHYAATRMSVYAVQHTRMSGDSRAATDSADQAA